MRTVVVTDPPRADAGDAEALGSYGVATVHEALGRAGYLGPEFRPAWPGARDAVPGLVPAVSAQGTVKATAGAVNVPVVLGGQTVRPGDVLVADDGVVVVPRTGVKHASAAAQARVEEAVNRAAFARGELGLDRYGLRDRLGEVGIQYLSFDDYQREPPEPGELPMPPAHEIAHLAHVELRTPVPEESLEFFTGYLGLTQTGSAGDSVFLRAWDDYEQTTIKLTAHATSGVGRTSLRAASPEALERRVKAIEATGRGIGWADGDPGYGPTYVFTDPDGHEFGLYYETQWYAAPEGLRPSLKNQAQAYPGRGVCVRRLDHINYLGAQVIPNRDYLRDVLGAMVTEQIVLDDGSTAGSWTTFTNKGYDAVYTRDWTGTAGRLHHLAFATDTRADILRAADIALDHGVFIETGPHKHAIQQTFFLYVYEPGGNRIELCNAGARLVLAPDWQPVNWTEAERAKGQAWGLKTIESFHTHGTPPVEP